MVEEIRLRGIAIVYEDVDDKVEVIFMKFRVW